MKNIKSTIKFKAGIILLVSILLFVSCGIECIVRKTGLNKVSLSIDDSKDKGVFVCELRPNKTSFILDSSNSFDLDKVWMEHIWTYDCVNGFAELKVKEYTQLVFSIKNEIGDFDRCDYLFEKADLSRGVPLCSRPSMSHDTASAITLFLSHRMGFEDPRIIIDTVIFTPLRSY
ncbi:MAG: hypothetical protein H6550_14575 [Chitinophagales bacterium]|nr:hypothetical protein [Chitinophagales bacterium]